MSSIVHVGSRSSPPRGRRGGTPAATRPGHRRRALADAGLLTLCLPRAYGGPGVSPVDDDRRCRGGGARRRRGRLVRGDRVDHVVDGGVPRTRRAPPPSTRAPATATGGVFAPNGRGVRVDDGFTRDRPVAVGEWHAALRLDRRRGDVRRRHAAGLLLPGVGRAVPRHVAQRRAARHRVRSTSRSTGHVVPDAFTVRPGAAAPTVDEPLARFPNFTLLALGIAAVAVGVARRALDELDHRRGRQDAAVLVADAGQQRLRPDRVRPTPRRCGGSARAYLRDEVGAAWDDGGPAVTT